MMSRAFVFTCVLAAATTACPPEPDPNQRPLLAIEKTSALTAANTNLRNGLVGTAQASTVIGRVALVDDLAEKSGACTLDGAGTTSCVDVELENDAEDLAAELAERVLNIANIEIEEEKRIVLKVVPERICDGDTDCIRAFNDVPVRVEITSRAANDIDAALLLDDAQLKVATMKLYQREVSLEVDLGISKTAITNLMNALGEDTDQIPSTLSGRVRIALEKNADRDYTASFHVVSAIDVAMNVNGEELSARVAAASPATSIRFDGVLEQITWASAFGEISGRIPLALVYGQDELCTPGPNGPICEPSTKPEGTIGFKLGAAKSTSVLAAGAEALTIDNIDSGSGLEITIDNLPLFAFTSEVKKIVISGSDESIVLAVSPSLVANLSLDLQNIADQISDVPAWMMNEDLTFKMDGAAEPTVELNDTTESIQMLAGAMNIHSRAAGRSINVSAGQCLLIDETRSDDDVQHPIELLSSGTCPAN